ncbi:ATP-dependent DEAD/DEAH box RNA helicase, putative [Bodo saltans]|uniref:ATP-dependent DEAD/DEAH box RNA helicase, putative n=1 Tax=Bodo saltans TaxID=75058 RepID=A0A0S4JYL8_BODSA|nr:ATP-dependent DEAD/DEAH box RNA helicase, putative [Bodo saltans]|eukprot:CUG94463.1 ATP-dependent DEAD/DEAH box RNA helicase, putative [Bodo saltans]
MKRTSLFSLRCLQGVKATATKGPEHLVESILTNGNDSNVPASQRFRNAKQQQSTGGALMDRSVQLRIGGAQMLSSTANRIHNHNEAHPLFFSQTSPRQAGLCATLVESLHSLRILQLTELQGALVPLFLKGKHVIAHAETGTGKSFGIALATANRILRETLNHRLHTVILVPTEELALQYDKWLKHFGGCASQVSQPAVDSIPLEAQLAKIHNIQPNVLVGTVQRIADIVQAAPTIIGEKLRRRVDCVILDEADVLLTQPVIINKKRMTGADLVERIYRQHVDEVPAQLIAISATIDGPTAQRLNGWMKNDKAVRITTSFVEHSIPHTINFYFFAASMMSTMGKRVASPQKPSSVVDAALVQGPPRHGVENCLELVLRLIFRQAREHANTQHKRPRILIFTDAPPADVMSQLEMMKSSVLGEWIGVDDGAASPSPPQPSSSRQRHWKACSFAGLLHQPADRSNPTKQIRSSELVARNKEIYLTNNSNMSLLQSSLLFIGVGSFEMSRGIHVGNVTHVIMYGTKSMPSASNFVHCAGRTGRMGKEGDVICIFPPSQGRHMQVVCNSLEIPFQVSKMSKVEALLAVRDDFMAAAPVSAPLPVEANEDVVHPSESMSSTSTLLDSTTTDEREEDEEKRFIRDPQLRSRLMEQMMFFDDEHQVEVSTS